MAEEISVPIVGGSMTIDTLKQEHSELLEQIKTHREHCGEFFDNEDELQDTLAPIEQDAESYVNGTIKTRPILKKYATYLCDKMDLESRIDASAEALRDVDLTPQQVKADMKHYVSLCEKKIASQQALCEQLQEQVKQLTEMMKCVITHPIFDTDYDKDIQSGSKANIDTLNGIHHHCRGIWTKFALSGARTPISLFTHATLNKNHYAQDFVTDFGGKVKGKWVGKREDGHNITDVIPISTLHYACEINDIKTVEKIIQMGEDVNEHCAIELGPNNGNGAKLLGTFCDVNYYLKSPMMIACGNGSLEMVKFLHNKGAKIATIAFHVPNGTEGDLVAGYLQTHGSAPVVRF
jgi:uncharacterized protein YdcH (DUF465 family)